MDLFNYTRRPSSVVEIGLTPMGGNHPIRIQSMTNTSTLDTDACVKQAIDIVQAGGEYVRLTAQGVREAENLQQIKENLRRQGVDVPLVADIHFNPKAAEAAAERVEKVRINPGNFIDGVKRFDTTEYTPEEYAAELEKLRNRFLPLLILCKTHKTALRIGVNHGSLSSRIMSRYGDTPEGMVESCMEFLRICRDEQFDHVVISIKASNTVMMVRTVRWLVCCMEKEQMHYPLHLGVTEAGDGEDGRVKSALGIGALLADGIGDTIRVSLSEEPCCEIPVARTLVNYVEERKNHPPIQAAVAPLFDYLCPQRRTVRRSSWYDPLHPWVFANQEVKLSDPSVSIYRLSLPDLTPEAISRLKQETNALILLHTNHPNGVGEQRAFFHRLLIEKIELPVIIEQQYHEAELDLLRIKAAADIGPLLIDGFGDGICLLNNGPLSQSQVSSCAYAILQAARLLFTKPEYISCPGCGRTLFNLQQTVAAVKAATAGQAGLKIGIMGCVVNGPGEMADADYGYVGSGCGRIDLYKKTTCVERNIPENQAVERLVSLIKTNGDWTE